MAREPVIGEELAPAEALEFDERMFEEDLLDELVVEELTIDCICGVY